MKASSAACALLALLALSGSSVHAQTSFPSIPAALTGLNLTGLASLVQVANLTSALSDPNLAVTLFAPSNDAVAATLITLNQSNVSVAAIAPIVLLYHAVPNVSLTFNSGLGFPGLVLPTLLAGQNLTGTTTSLVVRENVNSTFYIGGVIDGALFNASAKVTAGRSDIYIIDSVLIPPTGLFNLSLTVTEFVTRTPGFSILRQLILGSPEISALANSTTLSVTLLAPTDAAFNAFFAATNLTAAGLIGTPTATRVLLNHIYTYLPIIADDIPFGSTNVQSAGPTNDVITFVKTAASTPGGNYSITVQGQGNTSPIQVLTADNAAAMSSIFSIGGVILPNLS